MSEWMMAGVWRHILRLPPAIGKKRVGQLADRARAEAGIVSPQHRRVHHFVVKELPRFGGPMPPQTIAEGLEIPLPTVIEILTDLEARMTFLFRDGEGSVVWAYPVTAEETPHRVRFSSGEILYAA